MPPTITRATSNAARCLLLLALLLSAYALAPGQLALTQVSFPGGSSVDVSNYPKVRARIRATNDGAPITLAKSDLYLLQSNTVLTPDNVTEETNGVHVVEWTTSQFAFVSVNLLGYHNGRTATTRLVATPPSGKGARVVVRDSASRNLPFFVDYGTVAPGASDTMKLKIVATEVPIINGNEIRIRLESVTVNDPRFKVIWKGSYGSSPPPVDILSPLQYRIDLVCEPTTSEPLSALLTVTYEGGMRTDIMISANPSTYPRETVLNLVSPNGGESFAPCQQIPITWRGMVSGFYAYVEYTTNNGRSWALIDSTKDSTLLWKVPPELSDSARIRVSQKFQSSAKTWLVGENAPVTSAAYSADGRYLLTAYGNGVIQEWDVVTAAKTNRYVTGQGSSMPIAAVSYVGSTRAVASAMARPGVGGGTLQLFSEGVSAPTTSAVLPNDVEVRELGSIDDGTVLYVLPQLSGRILRYGGADLSVLSPVILDAPIASSAMNGNTISASLTNGEVVLVNGATTAIQDRSQTGIVEARGPLIHRAGVARNGRLVALAGKQLTDVLNAPKEQRTFVYDLQTDRIVKILYREGADAVNLSFSPSNAFLALGFLFNPQFVVYDLMQAKTLPPEGSAEGHSNRLTDLAFSPDGATIVSTSVDSSNNALIRRVSSPESDISDATFRIAPVQLTTQTIVLRSLLIGTQLDTVLANSICNVGTVPAIIERALLTSGSWLTLSRDPTGDTVRTGACLRLELRAFPRDTGLLTDTLVLTMCGTQYRIPLQLVSIDRDLAVLIEIEDFGDVCVGSGRARTIAMIRNDDSVAVTINAVFVEGGLQAQFRIVDAIEDTVIPPNGTLEVEVVFQPRELGLDTSNVIIRYADQRSIARIVRVMGRGSGADIQLSHQALPFIPEIPVRQLVVRNLSDNPIVIDSANVTAGEPFTVLTTLPVTIGARDSVLLDIRYNGGPVSDNAVLDMSIQPCASRNRIKLAAYAGNALLTVPAVRSDSRNDTASIPIHASITENVSYNGERFFEGAVTVHPRLFLAREVTTTLGRAEIVSQDVVNDMRIIRFRVVGAFSGKAEICRLIGHAGMAEVDVSALTYVDSEKAFGSAVQVIYGEGSLTVTHRDPNKRIIDRQTAPIIRSVSPNPATDVVTVSMTSPHTMSITLHVVDQQGSEIAEWVLDVSSGVTEKQIDVSSIPSGSYYLLISSDMGTTLQPLVITR